MGDYPNVPAAISSSSLSLSNLFGFNFAEVCLLDSDVPIRTYCFPVGQRFHLSDIQDFSLFRNLDVVSILHNRYDVLQSRNLF